MLDHYIWGDATRISPEAPVPVRRHRARHVDGWRRRQCRANIARLGATARFSASWGDDEHGARPAGDPAREWRRRHHPPGKATTIVTQQTRVLVQHQQLCRPRPRVARLLTMPWIRARPPHSLERRSAHATRSVLSDYAKGLLTDGLVSRVTTARPRAAGQVHSAGRSPSTGLHSPASDLITPNKREALLLAGLEPEPGAPFPRPPCAPACTAVRNEEHRRHAGRGRDAARPFGQRGQRRSPPQPAKSSTSRAG